MFKVRQRATKLLYFAVNKKRNMENFMQAVSYLQNFGEVHETQRPQVEYSC